MTTAVPFHLRLMASADLPAVLQVQAACYVPDNLENHATFATRLQAVPDLSWVGVMDGQVHAYLVCYRSVLGKVGALSGAFEQAQHPTCLYLHDLAVGPAARGLGLGQALITHALDQARREHLTHAALVSVQDSLPFWQQQGFVRQHDLSPEQQQTLDSYHGGTAHYMTRAL